MVSINEGKVGKSTCYVVRSNQCFRGLIVTPRNAGKNFEVTRLFVCNACQ